MTHFQKLNFNDNPKPWGHWTYIFNPTESRDKLFIFRAVAKLRVWIKELNCSSLGEIWFGKTFFNLYCLFQEILIYWFIQVIAGEKFVEGKESKTFISQYYFNHFFFRGSLSEKPYLLFHDPTKCLSLNSVFGCPTPQVCVEECPKQTTSLFAYATFLSSGGIIPNDFGNFSFDYQRQFCTGDLLLSI